MTMPQDVIGVDIAKDWIDIFTLSSGRARRIPSTRAALRRFAMQAQGTRVVFEASGGYERPLAEALAAANVTYARVNPRQAREFARASGRLAKPVPGPIGEPTGWMHACWPRWAGRWRRAPRRRLSPSAQGWPI